MVTVGRNQNTEIHKGYRTWKCTKQAEFYKKLNKITNYRVLYQNEDQEMSNDMYKTTCD